MGIKIIAELEQKNDGSFPIVDANNIRGGHYQVDTIAERDSIPIERRKEGMLCSVKEDKTVYQLFGGLTNSYWHPLSTTGSSTGDLDATLRALRDKKIIIPQVYSTDTIITSNQLQIPISPETEVVEGEVDVVDQATGQPILNNGTQVKGYINLSGLVAFNLPPNSDVRIVYGVMILLAELPEDFLKKHFYTDDDERNMIKIMTNIDTLEKEMLKENIKPTGLYTRTTDTGTVITFSYPDDPSISHFILEKYDEATGEWVPYDGDTGIITP